MSSLGNLPLRSPSQSIVDELNAAEAAASSSSSSSSSGSGEGSGSGSTAGSERDSDADRTPRRRRGRKKDKDELRALLAAVKQLTLDVAELKQQRRAPISTVGQTPFTVERAVDRIRSMQAGGGGDAPTALYGNSSIKDKLRFGAASFGAMTDKTVFKPRGQTGRSKDHSESDGGSSYDGDRKWHAAGRRRTGDRDYRHSDEPSLDAPLANDIYQLIMANHQSATDFVMRGHDWKNTRSYHEARRQAQIFDKMLRDGVSLDCEGMEMLARNIAGLWTADEHQDATLLEVMEYAPPQRIIPPQVQRTLMKDAEKLKKLRGGSSKGGRGAGRAADHP